MVHQRRANEKNTNAAYVDPNERDSALSSAIERIVRSGQLISLKEMIEIDPQKDENSFFSQLLSDTYKCSK